MRHSDADRTMATERYLLGEMAGPELNDFEEHMFECGECAAAVRTGASFAENARVLFREFPDLLDERAIDKKNEVSMRPAAFFWKWLTFPQLATSFAALGLACLVGFQQVRISRLNEAVAGLMAPQASYTLAPTARGTETAKTIPAGVESFTIGLDSLSRKCIRGCRATVQDSQSRSKAAVNLVVSSDRSASINLSRAVIAPGDYTVVVQTKGPDGEEVGEYPFRVQ